MITTSDSPAHRFLIRIADELSRGDVNFPTYLDAALKIRLALNRPGLSVESLARIVATEPLVSAKIIRLANSAALNPSGRHIADIKTAVMRIGFASIRTLAISVAIEQLMLEKAMGPYLEKARSLWEHSLDVAALAFVISRRMTRINPHEAMFAGLVHDIGHFYLLSQVARHPEIARDEEELGRILHEWHASIGHAVLGALETPETVLEAVAEHETPCAGDKPDTLAEVLFLANTLAARLNPFSTALADHALETPYSIESLIEESREELASIISALAG